MCSGALYPLLFCRCLLVLRNRYSNLFTEIMKILNALHLSKMFIHTLWWKGYNPNQTNSYDLSTRKGKFGVTKIFGRYVQVLPSVFKITQSKFQTSRNLVFKINLKKPSYSDLLAGWWINQNIPLQQDKLDRLTLKSCV